MTMVRTLIFLLRKQQYLRLHILQMSVGYKVSWIYSISINEDMICSFTSKQKIQIRTKISCESYE